MVLEVHVDLRWIGCRCFAHFILLAPLVSLWYYVIQNTLYTMILIFGLAISYSALMFAQLKMPLLKIVNDKLIYSNLFYFGTMVFSLDKLKDVSFSNKKVIFNFWSKKLTVNMAGMSADRFEGYVEKIKHRFLELSKYK